MALYHADIYLPPVPLPRGQFALTYSKHAEQEARRDRYGYITLPAYLDTRIAKVVEVEIENGVALKIVYRFAFDASRDIILVVMPPAHKGRGHLFVKTVWLNERSDNHKTLRSDRYASRPC